MQLCDGIEAALNGYPVAERAFEDGVQATGTGGGLRRVEQSEEIDPVALAEVDFKVEARLAVEQHDAAAIERDWRVEGVEQGGVTATQVADQDSGGAESSGTWWLASWEAVSEAPFSVVERPVAVNRADREGLQHTKVICDGADCFGGSKLLDEGGDWRRFIGGHDAVLACAGRDIDPGESQERAVGGDCQQVVRTLGVEQRWVVYGAG